MVSSNEIDQKMSLTEPESDILSFVRKEPNCHHFSTTQHVTLTWGQWETFCLLGCLWSICWDGWGSLLHNSYPPPVRDSGFQFWNCFHEDINTYNLVIVQLNIFWTVMRTVSDVINGCYEFRVLNTLGNKEKYAS